MCSFDDQEVTNVCFFSQRIQMKETVADAFISRFQLKPEETQALKGTKNGPISEVHHIKP